MKLALLGRQALMGAMAVALMAGVSVKTFAAENLLNQVKERGTLRVGPRAHTRHLVIKVMMAN